MQCEYVVTEQDFLESMKSYRKVAKGAAFAYYLDCWAMPILGFALIGFCAFYYLRGDRPTADTLIYLAFLGPLAIVLPPIFYRTKLKQAWRQRSALSEDKKVVLHFDNSHVRFVLPEMADVSYSWTSFTAYSERKHVLTLFIKKAAFHTIPRSAMDEAGWATFRECLPSTLVNI